MINNYDGTAKVNLTFFLLLAVANSTFQVSSLKNQPVVAPGPKAVLVMMWLA